MSIVKEEMKSGEDGQTMFELRKDSEPSEKSQASKPSKPIGVSSSSKQLPVGKKALTGQSSVTKISGIGNIMSPKVKPNNKISSSTLASSGKKK